MTADEAQLQSVIEALSSPSSKNEKVDKQATIRKATRVKRDALWKPILRKFRQWVRGLMNSTGLDVGCHYWSFPRLK